MAKIRDPVHGTVELSDFEISLLDTPEMQRLRGIRQLAMAYLVYPGANHTRFEHSIGTLALSERIARSLGLQKEDRERVRASALLHDIGHVAFSHESEAVLMGHIGSHEQIGERMLGMGDVADALGKKYSKKESLALFSGKYEDIVSSDLGADRMDYLLRDSHYTGVAYGVIDADRICSTLVHTARGLSVEERGLEAAESLLVARFAMFSTVYLHKTVRIASRMLQQAIVLAIEDGTLDPKHSLKLTDAAMLDEISHSKNAGELVGRLLERKLYKKAYSIPINEMKMGAKKAEKELSEKCGCSVLLDVPRLSLHTDIMLLGEDGKSSPLSSSSELVRSLESMQKSRLDVLVMCDEADADVVATQSKRYFG